MTIDLFHGDRDACGVTTGGGTESIVLAILSYREAGLKKGITNPNIVISQTAHAAFDKACFYLKVEIRKIPLVNRFDCNVQGMRKAVDSNTVCIVASAPDYGFGLFDPVPMIGQIAQDKRIGMHLDCCIGSYVVPFTEEAGFKIPYTADFRVEGVTTISCDPHKYSCGPKGNSVLMFRHSDLR